MEIVTKLQEITGAVLKIKHILPYDNLAKKARLSATDDDRVETYVWADFRYKVSITCPIALQIRRIYSSQHTLSGEISSAVDERLARMDGKST